MNTTAHPQSTRGQRFAWCLYDFANSAFNTVIITAVYVIYFKDVVVGKADPGYSDALWGWANAIAAAVVFTTAPFLGTIADLAGRKRAFLIGFTVTCVVPCALLCTTGQGTIVSAMLLFILAAVGFEGSFVFYNAFLPDLVTADKMGRLSGKGWALGYLGGLGCLLIALVLVKSQLVRFVPLEVALWYIVFAIPAFVMLRDRVSQKRRPPGESILLVGARHFGTTIRNILSYRRLVRFLVAYFFYNNAVVTIIVFAVAFSSDSLAFTTEESIILVILMNVVASPSALAFGWVADRIGAKPTLVINLLMWLVVVVGAELAVWPGLFASESAKTVFWGVAVLASMCIGAIQSTSRAFVGQLAPAGRSGEFYGFMAFAGKGSAVLGPLVFGLASDLFDSQRVAVLTIGIFFAIGLGLLARVPAMARAR